MSEKLSRKEMKAPDAFQKAGLEARSWLQERQRPLTAVVVLGLLGLGGVALASYVSGKNETEAAKDLGSDLRLISRPVEGHTAGESTADESPFKSEHEKDEA